ASAAGDGRGRGRRHPATGRGSGPAFAACRDSARSGCTAPGASRAAAPARSPLSRSRVATSASRSRTPSAAGLCSRLVEMDQRAADLAGAGEQVEQLVALAPADRALQVEEIFLEAADHLEHGFLVAEEDVAPHRGVGGGDAGEVAEAACGVLQYLSVEMAAEVVGGAHDRVGNQ